MKTFSLYTKFIISLIFLAAPVQAAIVDQDADRIMKAIDGICGDAWCEGAFNYHFQQVILSPEKNQTVIQFRMSQDFPVRLDGTDGQPFKAQINQRFYDVSCTLSGFASYDSLMQTEHALRWEAYTVLSTCIHNLEDRLSQVNQPL